MLLSDRIEFYAKLGMIEPFDPEKMKGASYRVTLGDEYYYEGDYRQVTDCPGQTLIIPKNSIVFVQVAETFQLPYYIAGRFNLKIKYIYQGLLLGTGPQVDPGFAGHLFCPLHNISSREIAIAKDDTFATIDFVKTTPFCTGDKLPVRTRMELYDYAKGETLTGFGGYRLVLFDKEKLKRGTLRDYIKDATGSALTRIVSSVHEIRKEAEKLKRSTRETLSEADEDTRLWVEKVDLAMDRMRAETRVRRFVEVTLVVLLLSTLGTFSYLFWDVYRDACDAVAGARRSIRVPAAGVEGRLERIEKKPGELPMAAEQGAREGPPTKAGHQVEPTTPAGGFSER
jgi:deoxycytidine triphosphate deaminase